MQPEDFAKAMEQAFKDALAQADLIKADAERIRTEAMAELDAAKDARVKAEQEQEKNGASYFAEHQKQIEDAARTELLRNLTRKHLELGKSAEAITEWLGVDSDFVQEIQVVLDRLADHKSRKMGGQSLAGEPKLRYADLGRGGTIYFENGDIRFDMWWEFGTDQVFAFIDVPSKKDWEGKTKLKPSERQAVLEYIAQQVIADKVPSCRNYDIDDQSITFYKN